MKSKKTIKATLKGHYTCIIMLFSIQSFGTPYTNKYKIVVDGETMLFETEQVRYSFEHVYANILVLLFTLGC